jgi:hypothetical protein
MGTQDTHDVTHMEGMRKGEEQWKGEEPGRRDTGTKYPSERPTGESDARDFTTVDPQEPFTEGGVKG